MKKTNTTSPLPLAVPAAAFRHTVTLAIAIAASATAQDTLIDDDFDTGPGAGTLESWTSASNASLYEYDGVAATDYSTSTTHAAEIYSGGSITLTDPLALGSSGYTSVTLTFSHKWLNPSTTRRMSILFANDGVNFVQIAQVQDSFSRPPTITLTQGAGVTGTNASSLGGYTGESFTDQAKFRFFYSSNSSTHRVYVDDIVITAGPAFSGNYWDSNGATGGAGTTPTGTWGTDTFWSTSADGDVATGAWSAGDVAVFSAGSDASAAYTVTVDGTQDIGGLSFKDGTPLLTGGTLNMTSDSFAFVADGLTATLASALSDDGGAWLLTRTGTGTLVLSGSNAAATGGISLDSGITRFESPAAINGTAENLIINSSGILVFGASFGAPAIQTALEDRIVASSAGTIAVDNNASVDFDFGTAALTAAYLGAIADTTYTGLLTPAGTTYRLGGAGGKLTLSDTSGMSEASPTFQVLGDVEISGNITAVTGTLTKSNSGTLILSGANTHSANTTASGGSLVLAGSNSAATQTTINAATVQLDSASNGGLASGPVSLSQNAAVLQAINADRSISNDVLLNASSTISGPQSLTINGALTTNNSNRQLTNRIVSGKDLTLAGQVNLSNNDTGRTLTIASGATSVDPGIGKTVISGAIVDGGAGAGGLTLTSGWRDSAPFYLSGTNTYSGLTNITNGLATIQGIQALSPSTTVLLDHTSGSNGKIALLDDSAGTITLPNPFQTRVNNTTGSHIIFVGNNNTANGGTSSGTTTGSTFVIPTLDSIVAQAGSQYSQITVTGANDYSLRIDTVNLNSANIRTAGQSWQTRFNPTTASLSLGAVTMADGNALKGIPFLQLEGTATGNTVTGVISDASDALTTGRPLNLNKTGSSEWTLSGTNTYTGDTSVTGGVLRVNGSLAAGSAVSVTGGTLGGTGTIGGSVTVAAAGNLAPGASAGTLSIGGALDISALAGGAGLLDFELGSIASSDKIAVTGTLTIGTDLLGLSDFNLTQLAGLQNGTYTLISSTGLGGGTVDPADKDGTLGLATIELKTSGNNIVLDVSGLGGGTPYDNWAGSFGGLSDPTSTLDFDNGGLATGIEWVVGGDPTDGSDDAGNAPTVGEDGTYLVFTYNRLDEANDDPNTTITVEYGSDLTGWTTAVNATAGVIINETPGSPADVVEVKIPMSLAVGDKLFARLNVVIAP